MGRSTLSIDVRNCVFKELSTAQPELVCVMHHAFLEGFVEQLAGSGSTAALEAFSSISRGDDHCRLQSLRLTRPGRPFARDTVPTVCAYLEKGQSDLMQLDDLTADLLDATIRRALRHGGDFAEVFVEDRRSLGLSLEDRRVERAAGGRECGLRGTAHERRPHLLLVLRRHLRSRACRARPTPSRRPCAAAPARRLSTNLGAVHAPPATASIAVPPASVATDVKAGLLRAADEAARGAGEAVTRSSPATSKAVSEC